MRNLTRSFLDWLKGKPKTWQDLSESERIKIRQLTTDKRAVLRTASADKPRLKFLPAYFYIGGNRGSMIWDTWGSRKRSPGMYDMDASQSNHSAQVDSVRRRQD
jgi:hypothetical protein